MCVAGHAARRGAVQDAGSDSDDDGSGSEMDSDLEYEQEMEAALDHSYKEYLSRKVCMWGARAGGTGRVCVCGGGGQ